MTSPSHEPPPPEQSPIRDLASMRGQSFWRSLDEMAHTDQFRQWLADEFPSRLADWDDYDTQSRRTFLKIMAASFTLALLPSCSRSSNEKIVPYVHDPDAQLIPGNPQHFATAITRGHDTIGVLATSYQGRPTKLEGNPDHPASLGSTDLFTQAQVLGLCDPDRSQSIINPQNEPSDWTTFEKTLRQQLGSASPLGQTHPAKLCLLTGALTSPTEQAQMLRVLAHYPSARWFAHEPISQTNARAGSTIAFGSTLDPVYNFAKAKTILSLDADFLFALPGSVRHARDFANGRRVRTDADQTNKTAASPAQMNRLYCVEPSPSITGTKADHRLTMPSQLIPMLAAAVAQEMGVESTLWHTDSLTDAQLYWASVCANDLKAAGNEALVLAGESQPASVHAMAYAINHQLGSIGTAVTFIKPADHLSGDANALDASTSHAAIAPESLSVLVQLMEQGQVDALIIMDTNPVYDAPEASRLAKLLKRLLYSVHLGLYHDETAAMCMWHLPMTHTLEAWGDARSHDGSASLIQPVINPLYQSHTRGELLAKLISNEPYFPRNAVRDYWRHSRHAPTDSRSFETWWRDALQKGVIENSALPHQQPALLLSQLTQLPVGPPADATKSHTFTLSLRPSATLWDGRYANNSWLQEIPDPLTKLTWGNALLISIADAKKLNLAQGDGLRITTPQNQTVTASVYLMPGQAKGELTLALGFGRWRVGQIGNKVGINAYPLRTAQNLWTIHNVTLKKTKSPYSLATTQNHQVMEGRDLFRSMTLAMFNKSLLDDAQNNKSTHPADQPDPNAIHLTLMTDDPNDPSKPNAKQQWGMSIDLTSCIGCNACTIACQAENAIPVVGKDQVEKGREMHWIRIDRYFQGSIDETGYANATGTQHSVEPDELAFHHQPVPCMHCEAAPCELVCPVGATQHSEDGLNEMIYNRCIGTRYCSNNCPYKVRRFNFFQYSQTQDNTFAIQKNPEVSVRARGVMEKCSYCVQRIRHAQIDAHTQGKTTIDDGDIVTACQQVCPTRAITFGDVADKTTQVSIAKAQPHDYGLLEELNTRPRTTYLAEIRNPNPLLLKGRLQGTSS